ncbi:MAG: hypothetical protein JST54_06900 [Deltaproteobacteria bacterium]|nr:hypothetical protein [Deltaproteobacteria bacterium]
MPRPRNVDPIRSAIHELGRHMAEQLAGEARGGIAKAPARNVGAARRTVTGIAACMVHGCGRAKMSKGLCSAHYQKAIRLKINPERIGAAEQAKLAADGRALRWKK